MIILLELNKLDRNLGHTKFFSVNRKLDGVKSTLSVLFADFFVYSFMVK